MTAPAKPVPGSLQWWEGLMRGYLRGADAPLVTRAAELAMGPHPLDPSVRTGVWHAAAVVLGGSCSCCPCRAYVGDDRAWLGQDGIPILTLTQQARLIAKANDHGGAR